MWGHFSIGVLDFMLKGKIQIFIEYKHMIQYIGVIDFKLKGKVLLEYLFIYLFISFSIYLTLTVKLHFWHLEKRTAFYEE